VSTIRAACDRIADEAQACRPPGLARIASSAALAADEELVQLRSLAPPERPLACQPGCAWCYFHPVALSVAEVARIVRHLRSALDADALAALKRRFAAIASERRGRGPDAFRRACPFLEADRCSIYNVRPLACRGMSSSDASACERDSLAGTQTAPVYEAQRDLHLALQLAIAGPIAADGGPDLLELVAAIAIGIDLPLERFLRRAEWAAAEFRNLG
jgi:hypothetical protein